jgi:hypothetical protein
VLHRHHALAKYGSVKELDGHGAKATRGKQANLFLEWRSKIVMDEITNTVESNPKCRLFLKNDLQRQRGFDIGRVQICVLCLPKY